VPVPIGPLEVVTRVTLEVGYGPTLLSGPCPAGGGGGEYAAGGVDGLGPAGGVYTEMDDTLGGGLG
jgi:hypothetical protein